MPHSHDVELEDFEIFSGHLALMKRMNGLSVISTFALSQPGNGVGLLSIASQEPGLMEFDKESYSLQFGEQGAFSASMLRITYSSLVTPDSTYDVNMTTGKLTRLPDAAVLAYCLEAGLDFCICAKICSTQMSQDLVAED